METFSAQPGVAVDALSRLNAALTGRYTVLDELGRGGMAAVFRAHDLKHDRYVALKVLNPELGAVLGAERFLAEIQTTAHLQHPNILPLFDSGAADGLLYYVMPIVEGETLRARMSREHELPINDALQIARGASAALTYAHRHGIIHRDVKPENILLQDGQALVSDFGIALAVTRAGGERITQTGISIGTPQYMSPEQAAAERQLDARTDQYSLATVLFEMLAGEPPFSGVSTPAILFKVMTEQPPRLERRRPSVPAPVVAAVDRALQKVPADRFLSMQAFADAIVSEGPTVAAAAAAINPRPARVRPFASWRLVLPVASGLALVIGAAWVRYSRTDTHRLSDARLSIALPDSLPLEFVGTAPFGAGQPALTISPDGSALAFVTRAGGRPRLALRRLNDYHVATLPGTDGAFDPTFSPLGDRIAFIADGELRVLELGSDVVSSIVKVPDPFGIAWIDDNDVLIALDQGRSLARVSLDARRLDVVLQMDRLRVGLPVMLPDGIHGVASDGYHLTTFDLRARTVHGLSIQGEIPLDSLSSAALRGSSPRYTRSGLLTFAGPDGSLLAVSFDPTRLRTTGVPRLLAPSVRLEALFNCSQYSTSTSGRLVFVTGPNVNAGPLARADRTGRIDTLNFGRVRRNTFPVSPDGHRIAAIHIPLGDQPELWIYDLRSGAGRQVALGEPVGPYAEWVNDSTLATTIGGSRVVLISPDNGVTGRTFPAVGFSVSGASPDGRTIVGNWTDSAGVPRAAGLSVDGGAIFRLGVSRTREAFPSMSPDGRWVAFSSLETGRQEVYVEPIPRTEQRFRISERGGNEALWLRDGELLYRNGDEIWAAPKRVGGRPPLGEPVRLFVLPFVDTPGRSYGATPDGRFVFFVMAPPDETAREIRYLDDVSREFQRAGATAAITR